MQEMPYKEDSKIFRPWFLLSFVPVLAIAIFLFIESIHKNDLIGIICSILTFTVPLCVLLLLLSQKLSVKIGPEGIEFRYFPLLIKYKKYAWADLQNIKAVTYNPIKDFGGWGLKISKNYGRGYTTKGNKGLWIQPVNGKSFLLSIINEKEVIKKIDSFNPRAISH